MRSWGSVAAIVLGAAPALAQYPFIREVDMRLGQERPRITCLAEGPKGLLWAGSDRGLIRTDGVEHELIFRSEAAAVSALAADDEAVLAALDNGLIIRCRGAICDTVFQDTMLKVHPVRAIRPSADGGLWLATYGAGVWQVHGSEVQRLDGRNGLGDDHVNALLDLGNGQGVAATDQGIAICDPTKGIFRTISEEDGIPDGLVLSLAHGEEGWIWAGTDRGGVFRFRPDGQVQLLDTTWRNGPVTAVCASPGMVWAGSRSMGMIIRTLQASGGSYLPETDPTTPFDPVRATIRTRDGSVWWCDGSDRIMRADPDVLFIPHHEEIDLRTLTALASDGEGRIWFAIGDRVYAHAANFVDTEKLMSHALPLAPGVQIVSLAAAPDGVMWAGTFGQGIFRIGTDGSIDHLDEDDGLVNNNVLAVRTRGKEVWFATLGGVCVWHEGVFTTPKVPGTGFIYDVLPLPEGGALAATDGSGVARIAPDGTVSTLMDPKERHRTFYSLCLDEQGHAWACGPNTGLCRVEKTGLVLHGQGAPPFDGDIFAMASYRDRILLFGGTGLIVWDEGAGDLVDPGDAFGLAGIEAPLNTLCIATDGALWFACDRGLVRLSIGEGALTDQVPAVITGLSWGDRPIAGNRMSALRYDQNFLTFGFAALHFAAPGQVFFQYQLDGFDAAVKETRDRSVSYSRLPPGDYTFRVQARLGGSSGSSEWTVLPFTIRSPWWRTPWAIGLWSVLALGIAVLLVRGRDRRLRDRERMEREKVRFQLEAVRSQVNPHFLFNSFNTLIELIEEDRTRAVEHVEHLSDFFRDILQVRDKDLIPLREELQLLENYYFLEKRRFGDRIDLKRSIAPDQMDLTLPPMTLQLLVENAIKHNVATMTEPLVISLEALDGTLAVRNPLRPRVTPERSTSYGLQSIRQRYAAISGRSIEISDRDGTFEVRIPLIVPASRSADTRKDQAS